MAGTGGGPRRARGPRRDAAWKHDRTPDVRDGLTRIERVVLWQISELEKERGGRNVPTAMLYGRVVEHVDISIDELQAVLQRLIGVRASRADESAHPPRARTGARAARGRK